ncbi:AzlD family protein [Ancylobacter terrae]|uniref:AzlD family protein n=1 Tax=Ancylobacter sp. sgz301288 TaxID=3342077 RepID=UPI00385FCED6
MNPTDAVLAIVAMALVTYLTRAGGIWVMGFMPMSSRVEAFLRYLAGSVLVALVVPAAVRGGTAAMLAVGTAAVAMAVTRKTLLSIALGVAAAALLRAGGGDF